MEYKISEKAEDPKDSRIEKRGHVINFTMREVENHEESLRQVAKELHAKKDLEQAKMTNIEGYHPFVLDLPLEDLSTVHTYMTAKMLVDVAQKKIEEVEKQLADYEFEKAEIIKQLPELEPDFVVKVNKNAAGKKNIDIKVKPGKKLKIPKAKK